jgi:hypothetical protein
LGAGNGKEGKEPVSKFDTLSSNIQVMASLKEIVANAQVSSANLEKDSSDLKDNKITDMSLYNTAREKYAKPYGYINLFWLNSKTN